ncbi:hypothetical protein [Pseudomonas putida]|uniref:hypothetical protein n=1 Tax=Pseudomonas putida TaxID=303 RepID=UPI00330A6091|nr:hypothetical protein [Pseudomonas putida]
MAQPVEETRIENEHESHPARIEIVVESIHNENHPNRIIKLNGLTSKQVDACFEGVALMIQAFEVQLKTMPADKIEGLVQLLVPEKPARPTLLREAKMLARAKTRILNSGDWLTAQDVAEVAQLSTVNASSQPSKWKRAGKIFALRHEGTDYFPVYGLDPQTGYRPRSSLAPVISVLADSKDGWGMAFWFGSSNSYLAGRLPKEVLVEDPAAVLEAARDEVYGALHG